MSQRQYNSKRGEVTRRNRRIVLPIPLAQYNELRQDAAAFRGWLDKMITTYPELFPPAITQGYTLHDVLPASVKLPSVQWRRIRLKAPDAEGHAQV